MERAGPSAGTGPTNTILQIKLPMLILARAFANQPGQNDSNFTPAALMRVLIFFSLTVTSLLCCMRAE